MDKKPVKTPEDLFELLDNVKAAKQVARALRRTRPKIDVYSSSLKYGIGWAEAREVYGKAKDS